MVAVNDVGLSVGRIFPYGHNAGLFGIPLFDFAELFPGAALAHVRLELEARGIHVDLGCGDVADESGGAIGRLANGKGRAR